MEEILKWENREQLYYFLITDFGLTKIEEEYYPESFGNFFITLAANNFFLRYNNDRLFLHIEIASKFDAGNWYALSFIEDFIYNKDRINARGEVLDNKSRIDQENNFLKKDFNQISELFSRQNYPNTQRTLDRLLKEQFKRNFPRL